MPKAFAVYVPATNQRNLKVGLENLRWGWKDDALGKRNKLEGRTNREIAMDIRPGDLLIMGTKGPDPRVNPGGWADETLDRVLFLHLTSHLHRGNTTMWPNEVDAGEVLYPNRVRLEVIYDVQLPEVARLDPAVLEALRRSANAHGVPMPVPLADQRAPSVSIVDAPNSSAGRLDHDGEFDILTQVLIRREQRKIRAQKFGDRPDLQCAICGRVYPARLVRAAHIKRRSVCSPEELLDLNNIMAACALGCDELFEHGYLAVDDTGDIIAHKPTTGDLARAVADRTGARCTAFSISSCGYFTWHRDDHAERLVQPV